MSSFHGNFFVRSTDLLSLAAVPLDQSYSIEIQIEDPISAPFVVFQTAVLHTTCYGERRIRVITLALPTTNSLSDLYGSVDTIAMSTLLTCKAVERSMSSKLEDARDAIQNKLVDILGTYKANMTQNGSGNSPKLDIAKNMKFLPLLMLGLLKQVSHCLNLIDCLPLLTLAFLGTDWNSSKHFHPLRSSSLCSSPPVYSSFPTSHSLHPPCLLFFTQHAKRGKLPTSIREIRA